MALPLTKPATKTIPPIEDEAALVAVAQRDPAESSITVYAMVKKRELANRTWEMNEVGISVMCWCEKGPACRERGIVYRPSDDVDGQMKNFFRQFQLENRVPEKKVRFSQIRQGRPFNELKLKVPSCWKDPAVIEQARQGFDKLRKR